ncbi:hypothetical protein ElyMa_000339000 [Elysia marginata]|uniref:Uncharacterized protein n=1 Tax=Elysia marginata TaxID=1093978 RepID=A0AAV4FC94_9GAST|nr:hypothetical protein ElyMa_000339000 [Elysia marginata]
MRSYHSPDCDTDHFLVASNVRLRPRQFYRSEQIGRFRVDTPRVVKQELKQQLSKDNDEALEKFPTDSAQARWDFVDNVKAAIDTSGK